MPSPFYFPFSISLQRPDYMRKATHWFRRKDSDAFYFMFHFQSYR